MTPVDRGKTRYKAQMSKIHVLLANDHLGVSDSIHGVGRLFSLWLPRFDRSRFDITVCILRRRDTIGQEFERRFRQLGIETTFLGRRKFDPVTLLDFLEVIRNKKIDIIHLQAYGASTFGRLAGMISGTPAIIHAHDTDSHYPWYMGPVDLFLSRFTERAIAVSEAVGESLVLKRKMPTGKVLLMPNAIALEEFRMPTPEEVAGQRTRLGIEASWRVIGTVAKLRIEKGIEYLLESVPAVITACPRTIFIIVGDGPLRGQLEGRARQLNIDRNVLFVGYREDVSQILSAFDIKVLPSLTEGLSLAILEAMAMGKPIIATQVGGTGEVLKDGQTGLLIPPKDSPALAEKIIYLLENPDIARRLGMRAQEESKKYDVNGYVRRLEELYLQLVSARRGLPRGE
jgi:glycosyltransferase involved in cell wall biosynthesis